MQTPVLYTPKGFCPEFWYWREAYLVLEGSLITGVGLFVTKTNMLSLS